MFCARLFICALWSPAGKGLTSWLSFVVSPVSLSLSHWYPGSGVVLDCIDSWSLQPYYLNPPVKYFTDRSKAVLLCYLCLVFIFLLRLFIAALWSLAGKGLNFWFSFVMCNFPMWYPWSDVVLDCIDSWILSTFFLLVFGSRGLNVRSSLLPDNL